MRRLCMSGRRAAQLLFATVALGCLPAALHGQLVSSVGSSIGQSVDSSNSQDGFSSEVFQGASKFDSLQVKYGILDPLGFLVENTSMTPITQRYPSSIPPSTFLSSPIADPRLAGRLGTFNFNSDRVSVAGASAVLERRETGAGGRLTANTSNARVIPTASSSFKAGSSSSSFLAGGTQVDRLAALSGGGANGSLAALASSGSSPSGDLSGSGSDLSSESNEALADPATAAIVLQASGLSSTGLLSTDAGSTAGGGLLGVASTVVRAGHAFPLVNSARPSGTGFEDSTRGTAGSPMQVSPSSGGPVLRTDPADSPFPVMSVYSDNFLRPSLHDHASGGLGQRAAPVLSYEQLERIARKRIMMSRNPTATIPTPSVLRHLQRQAASKARSANRRNSGSRFASTSGPRQSTPQTTADLP